MYDHDLKLSQEEVWLHVNSKYKIKSIKNVEEPFQVFGDPFKLTYTLIEMSEI